MRRCAAIVSISLALSAPALAADPPADPAGAELLFDEGRKLMDAGKLPEACAKFEASNRLDPAVGTLLNLGDCNERRNRVASAWGNYRAAQSLALTRNDPTRAEFAKKKAEAIAGKISTLTINIEKPEPGLKVTRDGAPVDDAVLGTALPTDPGPHTIEATAPGKKPITLTVTIPEGAPSAKVIKVDALVDAGGTTPPPQPPPKEDQPPSGFGTGQILGLAGVGAGVVAIGIGTYLGLHAKSMWKSTIPDHCTADGTCDDAGLATNEDARSAGNIATVLFVSGIVVAAIGVGCFLFWPKPQAQTPKTTGLRFNGSGFVF